MTEKLKPCKECATHRALMREAAGIIDGAKWRMAVRGAELDSLDDLISRLTAAANQTDHSGEDGWE